MARFARPGGTEPACRDYLRLSAATSDYVKTLKEVIFLFQVKLDRM
jgi:hypothetical protein